MEIIIRSILWAEVKSMQADILIINGQLVTVNQKREIINNGAIAIKDGRIVGGEIGGYSGGKVWSQDKKAEGASADTIGMETVLGAARKLAEMSLIVAAGKNALAE
jgi:hypothetical protein